jgi:hypothetical protein
MREESMLGKTARVKRILFVLVLCATFLGSTVPGTPALAQSTGTLKLMVGCCHPPSWLTNTRVDVAIIRPGVGQVDSDTGYTNGSGYVEFTFDTLQDADEAHVTVYGGGQGHGGHVYSWVESGSRDRGFWDLGITGDSGCADEWYDEEADIIKCVCDCSSWNED